MGNEFWWGVSVGVLGVLGGGFAILLVGAAAASRRHRRGEIAQAIKRHPSLYDGGPHIKVRGDIDIPLAPNDGIPPISPG